MIKLGAASSAPTILLTKPNLHRSMDIDNGDVMKYTLMILMLVLSQTALSRIDTWTTHTGEPIPNSDSVKSINGFGGLLIVTPDKDWEKKWNTSPETTPEFSTAADVSYGEELTILPFFINPKTNAAGEIKIICDLKITRPNGRISTQKNIDCASGKLQGSPKNVRLTAAYIKFIGEDGDPNGVWEIAVTITDAIRRTKIPLKANFNLIAIRK